MCTVSEQSQGAGSQAEHDVPLEILGRALRRAREAEGIGVREMASRLGCSPSHVSQVERGMTSPSVHTLFSMVKELGVSLDDLLASVAADAPTQNAADAGPWPGRIVRAADRRGISLPGGVKWEMLMPAVEEGFEFVEYVYEVGGHDGDDFYRRNGWEYGVVLEGRLGGAIGFAEFELEVGDSIAFDSSAPHRFWNAGGVPARAVWVWHNETGVADTGRDHPQYAAQVAAADPALRASAADS
jgi:transcriptional regulator with XRE-family HTH domain